MAFCNSCGANIEAGAKFCPKCGKPAGVPTAAPMASTTVPATQPQGGGVLKIVLIVVGVLVVLFVLGVGSIAFIGWRIAKHSHVVQKDGNVRVETPFGTVESTNDPNVAAQNVGIDLYPGATVVKGASANMNIGGMHTAAADFKTSDPANTVAEFYKSKVPNANVVSSEGDRYTIVSTDKKNMLTITIEPRDGETRIHIVKVTGKVGSSSSSD